MMGLGNSVNGLGITVALVKQPSGAMSELSPY